MQVHLKVQPGARGRVTQVKGMGRVYPGDRGREKPGAGSGRMVILKTVVVIPRTESERLGYLGECGHVTPCAQSGGYCHPGDCG